MRRVRAPAALALALTACAAGAAFGAPADCRYQPPAVAYAAAPRDDPAFAERHARFAERARAGGVGLLFLGDSLTAGWSRAEPLWRERFGALRPARFGSSGDRVGHLAWRVLDGELDGLDPQAVVLLVGTNDLPTRTPLALAAAIAGVAELVRCKLPRSGVLVLGLLPRADAVLRSGRVVPESRFAADVAAVNRELARRVEVEPRLRFADVGARFLRDGRADRALLFDGLHLSAEGYRVLADALQPELRALGVAAGAAADGKDR